MSDRMRWRYGDTNPVVAAVDEQTVVEIGDVVWHDTDEAKPAAALEDVGTKAENQAALVAKFLGVAMQRSRAGDTAALRVATTGVFEFDCAAASFALGDLIGPAGNADATGLLNQQVEKVATANLAIGRVARREPANSTRVLVDVRSTVMTGGV